MAPNQNSDIPAGWVGGFAESKPAFAYPTPDLTSLPMLDNMANIPNLQRQQGVKWPEFSWETVPGNPESRCFQMFAQDISRLGYDDKGRVWSIICPQQGVVVGDIGALNAEVTVTGQRGWANETDREFAADMTVEGKVWFSPSAKQNLGEKIAWEIFEKLDFPLDKANAIKVSTHKVGNPEQPIFPVRKGISTRFESPSFAQHTDEAWTVGNVEVELGPIIKTGHDAVDDFNQEILNIFNEGSGNMLTNGNVLTWNLWFTAPEPVDREKWKTHAERWRHSIDVDHGKSPDGSVSKPARLANGTYFIPPIEEAAEFVKFLEKLL